MLLVESDTDVEEEEVADPDVRPSGRRKAPRNVPGAPDVQPEPPNPDAAGLKNGRGALVVESDTDVEEEEEEGIVPDVRPSKGQKAPWNVPGAPDVEVGTPNPDVGATRTGRAAQPVGSDTDVEGEEADPDVEPPKRLKMTQNVPGTPDVRRNPPNPDVLRPKIRPRMLLVDSDTDVEGEEADPDVRPSKRRKTPRNVPETPDVGQKPPNPDVPGPKSGHRALLVESDTDVEEDPDMEPLKRLKMTQNVPETPDVRLRTPNPDVPGPKSGHRALLVESDTDVEEEEADPDVRTSEGREMTQNVPETPDVGRKLPNPDVLHPKMGRGALLVESDTDVEEDPDVESPKRLQMTQNVPKTPDVAAETPSPDVLGPRNGRWAQLVGSDTDVEADPDVEPPKQGKITQNVPGTPDVGRKLPNPDVSHPETRAQELLVESDTDVEEDPDVESQKWPKMTQSVPETPGVAAETPNPDVLCPRNGLGAQLVGSDTDVEADPDVEPPKQLATTQNVPETPDVGRKLPNPGVLRPKMGCGSDTDVEEDPDAEASERLKMTQSVPETPDVAAEAPNPDVSCPKMGLLVESDTDVEEDPDVEPRKRLQMTQNDPGAPDVGAGSPDPAVAATQLFPAPDPAVEEEEPDPDVQAPERLRMAQNDPGAPDVGPEAPDPAVAATQLFPAPDPAVEEEEPDPDVQAPERLRMAQNDPGAPDVGPEAPDPDVGGTAPKDPERTRDSRCGGGGGGRAGSRCGHPAVPAPGPDVEEPGSPSPDPDVATQLFPPPDPDVGAPSEPGAPDVGAGIWTSADQYGPVTSQHGPVQTSDLPVLPVLFTGLVASPALLVALGTPGGTEATSVHDCSHLVTDGARRTLKLLCALARGVPIVTPEWLLQVRLPGTSQ
ncbi:PREDICTED: mediator of DNA damage checkpoint protein 1-like [Corvus brachyrhynchos]|uniref:mediator of DNA damage checkpoint protein 1-like n=1 Tax=Corvus brachyrhynchos TaxID=85066 RepID=UPI0008165884|nr:PREDICTED: mediator of DNA damage checkpoint protein 1-like [Corvus brachyrhynchos]